MVEADVLARLFPFLLDQSIVNIITTLAEFGAFPSHF
jgi:hypothetical protein